MTASPRDIPEVLTVGRAGVDLYPLQTGVGLEDWPARRVTGSGS